MPEPLHSAFASCTPLHVPVGTAPVLTVVIDTEEEFDWRAPFDREATGVENISCQVLAQRVMDRYGIVPTYVVDYPVASTPAAVSALRAIADAGGCEIGAHLHPWVNPPFEEPLDPFHSYPGNLPTPLQREKLSRLANCIADAFGRRPVVYKAGRYGLGPATFGILAELGFAVDVSIVPHTDFSRSHGPDFTLLPSEPFLGPDGIVALPLSVHFLGLLAGGGEALYPLIAGKAGMRLRLPGLLSRTGLLERLRLSPEGHSFDDLARQTRSALSRGERYFMLTYHSSSLLPGANSYVRDEAEREVFLAKLDRFFDFFFGECAGRTQPCTEFATAVAARG